MNWFALSIVNVVCIAGLRLLQKAFVDKYPRLNSFRINWITFAVSLPVVLVIVGQHLHTEAHLSAAFWLTLSFVVVGFYPIVNYLLFEVIRREELSNVLPLLGLVPVLTAISGWLFLGQSATLLALIGIACISLSIYCLQFKKDDHWTEPFRALSHSFSARAMTIISIITALAAIGDKYAIEKSSTQIYFALNTIGAIVILFLCDGVLHMRQNKSFFGQLKNIPPGETRALFILGIVLLACQVSGFMAVNSAPNTSYTIAIRNLNIVLASLTALVIYKESTTQYKLLSYGLSAAGVVMIAL
ncbi:MAG: EamA family transporter [Candidatus Saccharimonadales bacterium]